MTDPKDEEAPDNVIDLATWKWKKERDQLEKELEKTGWMTEDEWFTFLRDGDFKEFDEDGQDDD